MPPQPAARWLKETGSPISPISFTKSLQTHDKLMTTFLARQTIIWVEKKIWRKEMRQSRILNLRDRTRLAGAVLVVLGLTMSSAASEKKQGAELLIQKKDGQVTNAERLAVKERQLILMESLTLSEVVVGIDEVKSIQVVKTSRLFKGLC